MSLTWLSCLNLLAPARAASTTQLPSSAPPHGALYQISDGQHTLLLFGTIHVGAPDFYPLEPTLQQALADTPVLALELDPENAVAMQNAVQRYAVYPAGQHLLDQFDPALRQRTEAALRRFGMPAAKVQQMRPWMLAMVLSVQEYVRHGYRTDLAVDNHLAQTVRAHGGRIVELEGAQRQMSLFSQLTPAQQAQFLSDTLQELDDADLTRKLDRLVDAWRGADSAGFATALQEMQHDHSFTSRFAVDTLLRKRNPGLAAGIAELLREQDQAVAAIGILHLVGPDSVPVLLGKRGLQVRQLY
ncbi:TraB/GumN family protein [Herbaspirillum sp. DW155]|uniref:TraB/GumN family protein n=1 Tax=Herbaspirillum sp. DW155 TaxID=3095609 RepID=UPI0030D3B41B